MCVCVYIYIYIYIYTVFVKTCISAIYTYTCAYTHTHIRICAQDEIYQTECISGNINPTWNEDFKWEISTESKFLTVSILDQVCFFVCRVCVCGCVCVCVCVYIYIYIHTYIYIYIYIYIFKWVNEIRVFDSWLYTQDLLTISYTYIHTHIQIHTYTISLLARAQDLLTKDYIYTYTYTCTYIYIYIYIHAHVHVHIHIHIQIHTHTHTHFHMHTHTNSLLTRTQDLLTKDDIIGYIYIDVRTLPFNKQVDEWYPLKTSLKKAIRSKSEVHLIVRKIPRSTSGSFISMDPSLVHELQALEKRDTVVTFTDETTEESRAKTHKSKGGGEGENDHREGGEGENDHIDSQHTTLEYRHVGKHDARNAGKHGDGKLTDPDSEVDDLIHSMQDSGPAIHNGNGHGNGNGNGNGASARASKHTLGSRPLAHDAQGHPLAPVESPDTLLEESILGTTAHRAS
jgi:hypothetical protein